MANEAFLPIISVRMDASTVSKRVALPAQGRNIRIFNDSAAEAWVNIGDSAVVAAIPAADTAGAGFPVGPNSAGIFREDPRNTATHIAVILQTGTGLVYATVGEGSS